MRKAAVIGGGAAGMMTAVLAAGEKTEIHLYEKNEKLGKKLFITGKGRCNVTNDCPTEEFFTNVVTNPKFLYSSAYSFDSAQVQEFFEAAGVRLKVERGNRVFPESDHSSDILRALRRWKELTEKGQTADLAKIEEDINERDYQDMHREHSPLVQAEDAVLVDSSEMTIDEVVEKILSLARERM